MRVRKNKAAGVFEALELTEAPDLKNGATKLTEKTKDA